jgi:dTDP-4-dehydrorhamnose reductase
VRPEGIYGQCALILEAWHRYHLPIALTEVHLGCTREEQLRWFIEAWHSAHRARRFGADVRGVTAWAMLGSMDWDSLVTRAAQHYEPGAFDIRAPSPRLTAIGSAMRDLAANRPYQHAALQTPGWWRRSTRFLRGAQQLTGNASTESRSGAAPLLICGAGGTLGRAFSRACAHRGLEYRLLGRADMDIARPGSVRSALERFRPWGIINAAGYVRVDDGEREIDRCFRENCIGPATLASLCSRHGARLLTFSSDLVFDGAKRSPYLESDLVAPLSAYGRAKAEAEQRVLATMPAAMVVRTSAFFGPWDEHNFVTVALAALQSGRVFAAAADGYVSPTYVPDLVRTALDLLIDGESGIWHLANQGSVTWASLAQKAASLAGLDGALIRPCRSSTLKLAARRPAYCVLGSERSSIMPTLEDALLRYFAERPDFVTESSSSRRRAPAELR